MANKKISKQYLLSKLEEACQLKNRSVGGKEIGKMAGFPSISSYNKYFGGIYNALRLIGREPLPRYPNKKDENWRLRDTPLKMRFMVFKRDNFTCQYCGASPKEGAVLVVDHKIPFSKGGETILENLITSCFLCNMGKKDIILETLYKKK